MAKITFHQPDGSLDVVEPPPGTSIMRAALGHPVKGIIGECGGNLMCATCHVFVREEFVDGLPPISEDEEDMLECTSEPRDERRSRLTCKILADVDFDLVEVDIPRTQTF
ncbi:MAG TPA: 2Fe-2S iron-sulfur cluster-binding protein [Pseudolysinimonas sp.]|nr:2Fe-2S iron-sulfur cluster-binding protein [Pseudolysinimonas sp.]